MPDDEQIEKIAAVSDKEEMDAEQSAVFRSEQIKDSIHQLFIWGLRLLGFAAILVVTLRVAHLALPVKWQFIPQDQLAHIDSLFLSGSIAVAISRHLRSVMGWEEKDDKA